MPPPCRYAADAAVATPLLLDYAMRHASRRFDAAHYDYHFAAAASPLFTCLYAAAATRVSMRADAISSFISLSLLLMLPLVLVFSPRFATLCAH